MPLRPPKAKAELRFRRLALITLAWSLLLLVLHAQGRSTRAILVPIPEGFYYAFEAVFLPAIVIVQMRLGTMSLRRAGIPSTSCVADSLALSAACFVIPDGLLLAFGRGDLLGLWARVAGPLALLGMIYALRRGVGPRWGLILRTSVLLALPALLLVR